MTQLLDASAFFAFFFDEAGRQRVEELFCNPAVEADLSALSSVELWARLKAEGSEEAFEQEWEDHLPLFEGIVPIELAHMFESHRTAPRRERTLAHHRFAGRKHRRILRRHPRPPGPTLLVRPCPSVETGTQPLPGSFREDKMIKGKIIQKVMASRFNKSAHGRSICAAGNEFMLTTNRAVAQGFGSPLPIAEL